ncbi:MAG: gliding motility-associated C-terminal domain-containing protein, partial [Flavobacteriaceae bacterium]|nr:gliding motility-associated C-terminal domain-containing protein [Flavobacteriaceae bacterium]
NSYTPIDVTVACATCINPEANYSIVDDCANGDQFLVDVDVTSMGDATTLTITDNQGSASVDVTAIGVTQFGPYPFGIDIIITVQNADDANCVIMSPTIQQLACLPDNDECVGAVEITPNEDGSCTLFTSGSITGATESSVSNGCNGTADDDVWYSFNATATDHGVNLSNIVGGDLSFGIYEGTDCNTLNELFCSEGNETLLMNGLTIGNTYYIRIYSTTNEPTQDISFDLCVFTVPPPIYTSDTDYTVEEIITDVLVGENPDCPQISNITYSTGTDFGSTNGIGYFEANGSNWPFESGLIMTSGDINNATGPEDGTLSDGDVAWTGDVDLENAIAGLNSGDSNNASVIEFDFVPIVDYMSFEFIFAAEEYGTFQCAYSDSFAFLLTDPNGVTTNLALVPGTTDPVSVFTVRDNTYNGDCSSENPEFFANYYGPGGEDPTIAPINFLGHTTIMTAESTVVPNEVYHIKLVIADALDTSFDSAVFIGAGSFDIGHPDLGEDITLGSGNEGCEGVPLTLDAGDIPDNSTTTWYMDGVLIEGANTSTLDVTETAYYKIEYTFSNISCVLSDEILVEFHDNPQPEPLQDNVVRCEDLEVTLEVEVNNSDIPETITYYWTYEGNDIQVGEDNTLVIAAGDTGFGEYLVTAIDGRGCFGNTTITVVRGEYPVIEPVEELITKCIEEDVTLEVNVTNADLISDDLTYTWYIDGNIVQSSSDNTYIHESGSPEETVDVIVTDQASQCTGETSIEVVYYQNEHCIDVPQGLSPDGDELNDCLILDHLEAKEDIVKAEVFNRYGVKVYELNEYVDQWCGTNQEGDLLPVGTYFYIIRFKSSRAPITSWIYLNY